LTEFDFDVYEAADGMSGLKMVEDVGPDLLIVDFAMPRMNGAELAKRARETHPLLPVVFVTGFADTGAIEAAASTDAIIVRKPFRASELQSAICMAINGSKPSDSADSSSLKL
jgi:DNA-binding response OmpR family regulator